MHTVILEPFIPVSVFIPLLAVMTVTLLTVRRRIALVWRLISLVLFAWMLANPTIETTQGTAVPPSVLILIDESASMELNNGTFKAEEKAQQLSDIIKQQKPNARVIVKRMSHHESEETHLFAALTDALASVTVTHWSAIVLVSDGIVHDAPSSTEARRLLQQLNAPIHLIHVGEPPHHDRRLIVDNHPTFALKGSSVQVRLTATSTHPQDRLIPLTIFYDDREWQNLTLTADETRTVTLPITHIGKNRYHFSVPSALDEDYTLNNDDFLTIEALHDSVRVLLLSGAPSLGGRPLRDFLKADGSVNLVHLTILRSGPIMDNVSERERALIDFPEREVFSEQIGEFDVIIFNNYRHNSIIRPAYAHAIERHVRAGAGLMMIEGDPPRHAQATVQHPLHALLPLLPTAPPRLKSYEVRHSDIGTKHPITRELPLDDSAPWLIITPTHLKKNNGTILLEDSIDKHAILAIREEEKGRIAQFSSNNNWLWAREFQGGGPHAQLLKKTIHWLLKDPALEEERLIAAIDHNQLTITRHSVRALPPQLTVTDPDGDTTTLPLVPSNDFTATAAMPITHKGLYRIDDGTLATTARTQFGKEYHSITPTAEPLSPLLANGTTITNAITLQPQWDTSVDEGAFIFLEHKDFVPYRLTQRPLLPLWLLVMLLALSVVASWYRESRF